MIREIMEVPLPRADSRRLMSFLTFHISMFFSASPGGGALMAREVAPSDSKRGGLVARFVLFGRWRGTGRSKLPSVGGPQWETIS